MKLKELFHDWDDGEGMPWLTVTPWTTTHKVCPVTAPLVAPCLTVIEAKLELADILSDFVCFEPDAEPPHGRRAVYNKRSATVVVRHDLEDDSTKVWMSVSPHGHEDGVTLSAGSVRLMLLMLTSLGSERLQHGSGTSAGWDWCEIAALAKVLVESIDHDEVGYQSALQRFADEESYGSDRMWERV